MVAPKMDDLPDHTGSPCPTSSSTTAEHDQEQQVVGHGNDKDHMVARKEARSVQDMPSEEAGHPDPVYDTNVTARADTHHQACVEDWPESESESNTSDDTATLETLQPVEDRDPVPSPGAPRTSQMGNKAPDSTQVTAGGNNTKNQAPGVNNQQAHDTTTGGVSSSVDSRAEPYPPPPPTAPEPHAVPPGFIPSNGPPQAFVPPYANHGHQTIHPNFQATYPNFHASSAATNGFQVLPPTVISASAFYPQGGHPYPTPYNGNPGAQPQQPGQSQPANMASYFVPTGQPYLVYNYPASYVVPAQAPRYLYYNATEPYWNNTIQSQCMTTPAAPHHQHVGHYYMYGQPSGTTVCYCYR
ncbi:hypothetical protein F5Y15DRAFT_353939 [Xylariaceae sp. FL0016]|nr:hypothetical protein F5Y15DRAFT_353939 [Xylariaceae sp. FL0016]